MDETNLDERIREVIAQVRKEKMNTISCISLENAKLLASRIEAEAKRIGVKAVVAITNPAARPVLVECMDDSFIASYDVALQKAFTVVSLKMSTIALKPLAQPGGALYGIQFTNHGQIVIFGGGEPLLRNGKIVGGLGVSGGTEDQDTGLAAFGARIYGEETEKFNL